jgi:hypothetical protein
LAILLQKVVNSLRFSISFHGNSNKRFGLKFGWAVADEIAE